MNPFTTNAKAILAGLVTFFGAVAAVLPGTADVTTLTAQNWLTAVVAGVLALNAVWAIPNKAAPVTFLGAPSVPVTVPAVQGPKAEVGPITSAP